MSDFDDAYHSEPQWCTLRDDFQEAVCMYIGAMAFPSRGTVGELLKRLGRDARWYTPRANRHCGDEILRRYPTDR